MSADISTATRTVLGALFLAGAVADLLRRQPAHATLRSLGRDALEIAGGLAAVALLLAVGQVGLVYGAVVAQAWALLLGRPGSGGAPRRDRQPAPMRPTATPFVSGLHPTLRYLYPDRPTTRQAATGAPPASAGRVRAGAPHPAPGLTTTDPVAPHGPARHTPSRQNGGGHDVHR